MQDNNQNKTLTIKEMAKYLRIGLNSAYILARQPGFPAIKLSPRRVRIPVDALDKWMQDNAWKM